MSESSNEAKSENLTLEGALKQGLVISKDEVSRLLKEELQAHEKSLKRKLEKELRKEMAKSEKVAQDANLEIQMNGTGLTDKTFAKRLNELQIPVRYWKCLRDEHIKMNRTQLWDYIRSQDNPEGRLKNQWH